MKHIFRSEKDDRGNPVKFNFSDGVEGLTLLCDSPLAKSMVAYGLISKDLKLAKEFLLESLNLQSPPENDNKSMKLALLIAFYTTYGKCFAQADGRKVKLDKSDISKEMVEVHADIIKMRNNYTAHSGGIGEGGHAIIALHPDKEKNIGAIVVPPVAWHQYDFQKEHIPFYKSLVEELIALVDRKIDEKQNALKKWVKTHNINDLYDLHSR